MKILKSSTETLVANPLKVPWLYLLPAVTSVMLPCFMQHMLPRPVREIALCALTCVCIRAQDIALLFCGHQTTERRRRRVVCRGFDILYCSWLAALPWGHSLHL